MKDTSLTYTFTVTQTPEEVFVAINNVRGWWSGDLKGDTDALGSEFTYRYKDVHYSKQKIVEMVPNKKVVWQVLESQLNFIADKSEWNGTQIVFEIVRKAGKTEVCFTHRGLNATHECYDNCSNAWNFYITTSLKAFITADGAHSEAP